MSLLRQRLLVSYRPSTAQSRRTTAQEAAETGETPHWSAEPVAVPFRHMSSAIPDRRPTGTVASPGSPGASTLGSITLASVAAHRGAALRFKEDGIWRETSYPELGVAVEEIALGLIAHGVEPGDHVAILSDTRPEWTLADLAIL